MESYFDIQMNQTSLQVHQVVIENTGVEHNKHFE